MKENLVFEKIDYTVNPLSKGDYECCRFINCNFYHSDLSNVVFRECTFSECDLSLTTLKNTVFNDIKFVNCKLLGMQFHECKSFLFSVDFENCVLKLAVFYKMKLKKTMFKNCDLQEADFSEADLSDAVFENCDLQRATFDSTILEKADFRTAYNYSFDPERNRIKKARFSQAGINGLLDKYDIDIE